MPVYTCKSHYIQRYLIIAEAYSCAKKSINSNRERGREREREGVGDGERERERERERGRERENVYRTVMELCVPRY